MNIFSITAEALGWTLLHLFSVLQKFLEINYCIVAFFIEIFHSVKEVTSETILCIWDVLHCYYCDFRAFSSEFTAGVYFIAKLIFNLFSSFLSQICTVVGFFIEIANLLHLKVLVTTNFIVYYMSQITENLIYCIHLLFAAILLLLQLGPNLLILFYEGLLLCSEFILTNSKYAAHSIFHHLYVLQLQWFNTVLSIPAQAYIGLFLLTMLLYFYKRIRPFLQLYFILLASFSVHLIQKICYCIFIIFAYSSKIIMEIVTKIHGIFIPQRRAQDSEIFHQPSTSHTLNCQSKRTGIFYRYLSGTNINLLKIPFIKIDNECMDQQVEYLKRELFAEKEKHLCVVCHDNERNVILFPCRHLCMCENCTIALQSSFQGCPLCRRQILNTSQVYT